MQTILLLSWLMQVQINVGLPTIRFETAPQVVEVQPGVFVVPDRDDEVFYADGWYWTRWNDGRWYRTRNHRGGWVYVNQPPVLLARMPPGHYKHHHGKPERMRVINPDGTVTEYKVKEKHGVLEVKGKGKEWKGKDKDKEWKGNHGKGHGHH
jgi:hypothetical protein